MSQTPFDVTRGHRWFAIEFNNRAWDLIEKDGRSAEETQEMLHAAHASAIHWRAVGNPLNFQRAECLLATAYLKAGRAEPALRHAQQGLALGEQNAAEETPFDRATTLAAAGRAHALAGDAAESERLLAMASVIAATLEADDQAVFQKIYG